MHVDGVFAGDNVLDGAAADLAGGLVGLGGVRHGDGIDGISICRVSVVAGVQTETVSSTCKKYPILGESDRRVRAGSTVPSSSRAGALVRIGISNSDLRVSDGTLAGARLARRRLAIINHGSLLSLTITNTSSTTAAAASSAVTYYHPSMLFHCLRTL